MFDIFVKNWKGELSLAKSFWLVYVLFIIIIQLVLQIVFSKMLSTYTSDEINNLMMMVLLPYIIYCLISTWRCSEKSAMMWKILARGFLILAVLTGIFGTLRFIHLF